MVEVFKENKQEDYVKDKCNSLKFTLVLARYLGLKTIDVLINATNGIVKGFTIADEHLLNAKGCYTNVREGVEAMGYDYLKTDIKRMTIIQAESLMEVKGYKGYEEGEREAIEMFIRKEWEEKVKHKQWIY